MTLLEDQQSVRVPGVSRRRVAWGRLALGLGVAVAMLAAIGLPVYADHYQPLGRGSVGGRGPDSGLLELNDGLQATRWVVAEPGEPARFMFSLANQGRHTVKVVSVGDPADESGDYFRFSAARMADPGAHCCSLEDSLPFAPFELKPGQQRLLQIAVTTQPCEADEAGGQSTATTMHVAYRFWGKTNEAWVPLELPVVRACPATGIRPHIEPAADPLSPLLVPSPYQFGVPRGWKARPLENFGGPASSASWTSPDGKGKVEYEVNGGMAGVLYDENDKPTESGARDAAGCDLTAFRPLYGPAYEYTCRGTPATRGILRTGVIRIKPYPEGFERIEIRSSDMDLVTAFLNSVKA